MTARPGDHRFGFGSCFASGNRRTRRSDPAFGARNWRMAAEFAALVGGTRIP
jgi:hypothetical protein